MMSGVPLETCWVFNKLWNYKFYYKAASCWYFYSDIRGIIIATYFLDKKLHFLELVHEFRFILCEVEWGDAYKWRWTGQSRQCPSFHMSGGNEGHRWTSLTALGVDTNKVLAVSERGHPNTHQQLQVHYNSSPTEAVGRLPVFWVGLSRVKTEPKSLSYWQLCVIFAGCRRCLE
jgi:hypothetical protein